MEHPNSDKIRDAVAATVRAELAANGISGPEAARRSGISYQTLRRYLDGSRDFPTPALYQLADAIGLTPDLLVTRSLERMSDNRGNVTPLRTAENFTAAELDALTIDKAANTDTEIMRGSKDPD
jgi:transcriptional regulator with XRE-family HTH domain